MKDMAGRQRGPLTFVREEIGRIIQADDGRWVRGIRWRQLVGDLDWCYSIIEGLVLGKVHVQWCTYLWRGAMLEADRPQTEAPTVAPTVHQGDRRLPRVVLY